MTFPSRTGILKAKQWIRTAVRLPAIGMSGLFSDDMKERVRAANDIVDVIGSYIPLKKAGANFVGLCPFHKEKTPSFNVHPQRQIFHCFGCHKGGDVFRFVQDYESVDFPEAMRRLADRARIPIEYQKGGPDAQIRSLKEKLFQIHEQLTQRWQNALANESSGQLARDYLARRQVDSEAIGMFRLGAAPDAWDDTVNWARSKGFDLADVQKAGLILPREGGGGFYDRFRGRLMFPICDEQGRVIGFSGRVLAGDEKAAKYVNSPETPIFVKSRVFFGLDKSKRAVLDAGHAIICEGQLDLIACFMAGVRNVVAPQGTAFTAEHARILKRYVNEVVLCFDSDQAGQTAIVRSLDVLLASELAIRVAVIPPPHDPDSFIKERGGEAFRALIARAEGFFDYYLGYLGRQHDVATDKGRLAILRAMGEAVNKTGNQVLIENCARKTSLHLGVSAEAVLAEFHKLRRGAVARTAQSEAMETPEIETSMEPPSVQEQWLLKLLLGNDELVDWAVHHLNLNWIGHALCREVLSIRFDAHRHGAWSSLGGFLECLDHPHAVRLATEAVGQGRSVPNPQQQLEDLVLRLRNAAMDREIARLTVEAARPETSEEKRHCLLRQQQQLRLEKRTPLTPQPQPGEG